MLLTSDGLNATAPYAMPEELAVLRELSKKLNQDSEVVMIGAGPGVMAVAVMEVHKPLDAPNLHIIEIDSLAWVETHLDAAGVSASKVTFVQGDSGEVGKSWQGKIDLLIVDGDHSERGVGRDIDAWWDKVKPGGIVYFHDWLEREGGFNGIGEWHESGVAKAVNARLDLHLEILNMPGISMVVRKVG